MPKLFSPVDSIFTWFLACRLSLPSETQTFQHPLQPHLGFDQGLSLRPSPPTELRSPAILISTEDPTRVAMPLLASKLEDSGCCPSSASSQAASTELQMVPKRESERRELHSLHCHSSNPCPRITRAQCAYP